MLLVYNISKPIPNCSPGCILCVCGGGGIGVNVTCYNNIIKYNSLVSGLCSDWNSIVKFNLSQSQSEVQPHPTRHSSA